MKIKKPDYCIFYYSGLSVPRLYINRPGQNLLHDYSSIACLLQSPSFRNFTVKKGHFNLPKPCKVNQFGHIVKTCKLLGYVSTGYIIRHTASGMWQPAKTNI